MALKQEVWNTRKLRVGFYPFQDFQKKWIGNDEKVLWIFGCPGSKSKIIHIAGTKWKRFRLCLSQSYFNEGWFFLRYVYFAASDSYEGAYQNSGVSCHWVRNFAMCFIRWLPLLNCFKQINPDYTPTFFELIFFMKRYSMKNHTWLYHSGNRGWRKLDATNVIHNPVLCILTDRAGSYAVSWKWEADCRTKKNYKTGVPVVYMDKRKEVSRVYRDICC